MIAHAWPHSPLRWALMVSGLLMTPVSGPALAGAFDPLSAWTVVAAGGEPTGALLETHLLSTLEGNVCAADVLAGSQSRFSGDVIATAAAGTRIRVRSNALLEANVATGGAAIAAIPRGSHLPGIPLPSVPSGRVIVRRDGQGSYDTTGRDARVADCRAAHDSIPAVNEALEALPTVLGFGGLRAGASETVILNRPSDVDTVVVEAGRLFLGQNARLVLNAAGSATAVFIIRVQDRIRTRLGATIELDGGLDASRVLIFGRDDCQIGERNTGVGTLYCPAGKTALRPGTTWDGAVVGGGSRVEIGAGTTILARPFAGVGSGLISALSSGDAQR